MNRLPAPNPLQVSHCKSFPAWAKHFGKWHNGANHPSTARGQGFDEFFGFNGGFFSNYFDPALEHDGVTAERKGFITDVISDAAMAFMEKHKARPFFCYVPFNACHSPMQAPDDLFAKYSGLGFEPKTAAVYAMVENLDSNVGRMLAKLDALGLAERTIVMFSSDNGPNTARFNGGMRGGKGSLFEGGQRVPCFIRWPGKLEAGRRVPQIAQHVDVLPTLLELAGVPLPEAPPLDGVSLAPLLRGEVVEWPERDNPEIQANMITKITHALLAALLLLPAASLPACRRPNREETQHHPHPDENVGRIMKLLDEAGRSTTSLMACLICLPFRPLSLVAVWMSGNVTTLRTCRASQRMPYISSIIGSSGSPRPMTFTCIVRLENGPVSEVGTTLAAVASR